jgi:hypothetical protein
MCKEDTEPKLNVAFDPYWGSTNKSQGEKPRPLSFFLPMGECQER